MPLPAILGFCLPLLTPMAAAALPPVQLATFGVGDTMLIVVVALIVFGPKKLPEISRQIGKLLYEFRKASNDFKFQIEEELRSSEQAERQKQLATQAATPQPATPVAMTAVETVSAEPSPEDIQAPEGIPAPEAVPAIESPVTTATVTPETPAQPAILPPASGLPVSSRSPYRATENAEGATSVTASGESLDEMQANAHDAVQSAAADPSYNPPADTAPSDPVPTHHG